MKWIENLFRKLGFFFFRVFLRNKHVQLPLDTSKIRKILLLRYDVLGDMIVTTPLFNVLKNKLPNVEIHVLGSKRNVGLLAFDNRISKVLCYEKTVSSLLKIRKEALAEKYDCILPLVFNKSTNAGLWANWMGGRKAVKIGWTNSWRRELYKSLYNAQIPSIEAPGDKMTMSQIIVYFACKCFGWKYSNDLVKLSIVLASKHELFAHEYYSQFRNNKTVLINISAGKVSREMPVDTLSMLIKSLTDKYPLCVVLLNATKQDSDKALHLESQFQGRVQVLPYSSDVLNFCALVKLCSVVISPDTAIIHIASTFDIPVVGLYKNSEHHCKEWGPQHDKAILVHPDEEAGEVRTIKHDKIFSAFEELNNRFTFI